jgi:hypothetical protein
MPAKLSSEVRLASRTSLVWRVQPARRRGSPRLPIIEPIPHSQHRRIPLYQESVDSIAIEMDAEQD